jgi:hypothetical protein
VSSIAKHFDDNKQTLNIFVDGDDRENKADKDWFELRWDGPRIKQFGHEQWQIYVAVNVVVSTGMTNETYRHTDNIGFIQSLFIDPLIVYKYKDTDPVEQLGCLRLLQDGKNGETLRTNQLGQVEKTLRFQQATIEGHYQMDLLGD